MINVSNLKGFKIAATDGSIGTVTDFLFDDESWTLRWIVVETGSWLSVRKVLLPVSVLGHPDTSARSFPVRLTMAKVKDSPAIDTHEPVSRQHEERMYAIGIEPVVVKTVVAIRACRQSGGFEAPTQREGTTQAMLIAMLSVPEGATMEEIIAETQWQAHTARGAMSGALRNKLGLVVVSAKEEGRGRVYLIGHSG